MKHLTLATTLLLLVCASPGSAEDKTPKPLTLALSATIVPAPAQVTARISVQPDARSRSLTVEWWSQDGAGGVHEVTLDGDRAATRQDFPIRRIEAGTYVVRATVRRDDGSVISRESNLVVVGEGTRFDPDMMPSAAASDPNSRRR